jgi:sugar/nucleoside kinase (ribokinase family)
MSPTQPTTPPPAVPLDYLLIGHVTQDVTPQGLVLGGTVSYSAMTAAALGLKVGIITVAPDEVDLSTLAAFPIHRVPSAEATTYENIQTPNGRIQYLHKRAPTITVDMIPQSWRAPAIVHFAPVAFEIDPALLDIFPDSFRCITPQGCMRTADQEKRVHYCDWEEAESMLPKTAAAVFSVEDVQFDEKCIQRLVKYANILAVTEGEQGARVYWKGDIRHFNAPQVNVVDPTGAGDIFAAVFFARLFATRDAWLAGAQAVQLASMSVTRRGVASMPTAQEIQTSFVEIFPGINNA